MRNQGGYKTRWLLLVSTIVAGLGWIPLKTFFRSESPVTVERAIRTKPGEGRAGVKTDLVAWNRAFAAQSPPPRELRGIADDSSGMLENGVRFAVMESPDVPGEVSLRFVVRAGSIHERADERGLAHFVEHMAFRRTARRPAGRAMEEFQRLGLAAGADLNAHTAVDHTLYRFDLQEGDEESLEAAMLFFRDVADGLLFKRQDVEEERAVVSRELAERETGEAFALRSAAILPGVTAAENLPRGLREVVESATPDRLRKFWRTNYTSSRMIIVAVGDLHAADMIGRIRRHFGSIPARTAPAEPEPGDPLAGRKETLEFVTHEATAKTRITIAAAHPIDRRPDSVERRREQIAGEVALQMLQARLGRRFEGRNILGMQPQVSAVELSPGVGWVEAWTSFEPGREAAVLQCLVEETRRALEHGFERREFAEARGEIRRKVRTAFASRQAASVANWASSIVETMRTGRIFESPHDELNRSLTNLTELDALECEDWLRVAWGHEKPRIVVSGVVTAEMEETARWVMGSISPSPLPLPEDHSRIPPLVIEPAGSAGEVVEQKLVPESGYLEVRFANQVVLCLAPIPSMGGHVEVRVRIGHGRYSVPPDRPGLVVAAGILGQWHPLEGWRQLTMNAALAEEDVSMRFTCESDAFQWSGTTHRSELRRQLDILCACATRPGVFKLERIWKPSESVSAHIRARAGQMYSSVKQEATRLMTGRDPRFELLPSGLMDTDSDQVAEWLKPSLTSRRIRIVISGDFEPMEALREVAATFGALPIRQAWDANSPFPGVTARIGGVHRIPADGTTQTGNATLLFPLGKPADVKERMRHWILAELMQLRLRSVMRESLGESYSPRAGLVGSADGREDWLYCHVPCTAGREDEVGDVLRNLAEDLGTGVFSEDEFFRAVKPIPHTFRKAAAYPSRLAAMMWHPRLVPDVGATSESSLLRMKHEVAELARRVLKSGAGTELRVMAEE